MKARNMSLIPPAASGKDKDKDKDKQISTHVVGARDDAQHNSLFWLWVGTSVALVVFVLLWPHFLPYFRALRRQTRMGIKWYTRVLIKLPLFARAVTAGIIFSCADISAQLLVPNTAYSLKRTLKFGSYGFGFMGPFLHLWYMFMHEYAPGDSFAGSLVKSIFEEVTLEPICIACFLLYDCLLNRKKPHEISARYRESFMSLWKKNAYFWIPGNFLNYYVGTPDFRVIFANCCSFWWNVYFSLQVAQVPNSAISKPLNSRSTT
ncbi:Protein Mpv17 [Porphyridium purpureum]|uniref:Protein Mpv17 n=1 Tax=Porphyridium purpureum TaxID=35688 RepID=A0A5J4YZM9_PORPP|nr:Protein Mpv17 [Porphyridium purpureum]|eukprot:POR3502..scf208_2